MAQTKKKTTGVKSMEEIRADLKAKVPKVSTIADMFQKLAEKGLQDVPVKFHITHPEPEDRYELSSRDFLSESSLITGINISCDPLTADPVGIVITLG